MEVNIQPGQIVYTVDGQRLGAVKQVASVDGLTYFEVDVSLRPDYWLAASWVDRAENVDGEDRLLLDLSSDLLKEYKLPGPA